MITIDYGTSVVNIVEQRDNDKHTRIINLQQFLLCLIWHTFNANRRIVIANLIIYNNGNTQLKVKQTFGTYFRFSRKISVHPQFNMYKLCWSKNLNINHAYPVTMLLDRHYVKRVNDSPDSAIHNTFSHFAAFFIVAVTKRFNVDRVY